MLKEQRRNKALNADLRSASEGGDAPPRAHPKFGWFRSWFCPVQKKELGLFLPLVAMFFFICFDYNLLRAAKDSLIVTGPSSGAEVIPFVKTWVVLPMAFLMTFLFTRLVNRYRTEKVFYMLLSLFIGFYALFSFVIYPMRETLHPHRFADYLETLLPLGLKGFVALIRNWSFTLFYTAAELWSTTIMTVLFWGFVNEILDLKTAKRFYVLILIGGNLAAMCAGGVSTLISSFSASVAHEDPWQLSLMLLSGVVCIAGLLVMGIFRWLHRNGLSHNHQQQSHPVQEEMGLRNSFRYLLQSKYLLSIATIVLTYHICINLTEVTWKDQLLHAFPDPNTFNSYMGKVTIWVGAAATCISLITSVTMQKFSWTWNALVPPVLLLITGIGFFACLLAKDSSLGLAISSLLGTTPYVLGVAFGSMQQSISRASKYTIFDATKELAFIPLSRESKLKGKAAIDGVGSRLGKSGSAVVYQMLLLGLGTVSATLPYVALTMLLVVIAWMFAVIYLGKQFRALTHQEPVPG